VSEEEYSGPNYCPECSSGDIDYRGSTDDGWDIIYCHDCGMSFAIRNVTGKVKLKVEIQE